MVLLVRASKVHSFYSAIVFQRMPPSRLPASFARYGSRKVVGNRKRAVNTELAGRGKIDRFFLGRCNGFSRVSKG